MSRERFPTTPVSRNEKSTAGKENESEWSADEALQFAQTIYAEEIDKLTKILNVGYAAHIGSVGLVCFAVYNMAVNHAGMDIQQNLPFLLGLAGMSATSAINTPLKWLLRRKQDNLDKMKGN